MFIGLALYEMKLFSTSLAFPLVMTLFTIYYYFMNFGPGPFTVAMARSGQLGLGPPARVLLPCSLGLARHSLPSTCQC
ncbi:hypothetical protein [Vulcanisaeta souniana]|uniref:hypothetical protein n=1 Tax=Vulcanisaeta souniana TaxID=164452 RepID=UPI001FB5493C|nr:hypothetical protein [Vulcanisaeta souniana]